MNLKQLFTTPINELFQKSHEIKSCDPFATSNVLADIINLSASSNATTPSGAMSLYEKSTAVSIPVNFIAELFAVLNPVIYDSDEVIREHEILTLLANPSPFFTRQLFLEMLAKEYLISGNCFSLLLGDVNKPPLEIMPASVRSVQAIASNSWIDSFLITSGNLSGNYQLKIDKKRARYFDGNLRELAHLRAYSTRNDSLQLGDSPLLSASREVRQHILGNDHNVSLLEKGGRVSLIFNFKEDFDAETFKQIKEGIRSQFGGASNAGQIGVTSGENMEIVPVSTNNRDMDFATLHQAVIEAIAKQYKFPLQLLDSHPSFNNYSSAKLSLYDDAILPLADKIFGYLTNAIVPRFKLDPAKIKIGYSQNDITALESRRQENLKFRKEIGIETDNELRAAIGREPYKGGDTFYKPMGLVPVGTDAFIADNSKKKSLELKTIRDFELELKTIDDIASREYRKIHKALLEQQTLAFNAMDSDDDIMKALESAELMPKELKRIYQETAYNAVNDIVISKKGFEEDLQQLIDDYFNKENTVLTDLSFINEATAAAILNYAAIGLDLGLTANEIQQNIIDAGTFSPERALRISRTTIGTAQSIGQTVGAKSAGARFKTWVTSGFEVRTAHDNRNAETVGIDERFSKQFDKGLAPRYPCDQNINPSDRINCRCSMVFKR